MSKQTHLTLRAKKDLYRTEAFYSSLYGVEKTHAIILSLLKHIKFLENNVHDWKKIGAVDEDFNHLKHSYRKLFHKHIKINYREGQHKIYITRIFDTRQDPKKNF